VFTAAQISSELHFLCRAAQRKALISILIVTVPMLLKSPLTVNVFVLKNDY